MANATVMTVLGPVDAGDLGITLPHEHLLIDLTCLWRPRDDALGRLAGESPVTAQRRWALSGDPYSSRDNLVLDDPALAIEELSLFANAGGRSLVDLTSFGLGPRPADLRTIALATGLHIVAGCGYYIGSTHPPDITALDDAALADRLLAHVQEGLDASGVRPGIIGEIGTSATILPQEAKVLRAGARVQAATGLAINVHLSLRARNALEVLDIIERAGGDPRRVVLSHLDEHLDIDYHRSVLARGSTVSMDTFGSEHCFDPEGWRESTDAERIGLLLRLIDEGAVDRLLLSQDVCTKTHLTRHGGYGYSHILTHIVPRLRRSGVDEAAITRLLVVNPARMLVPFAP